MSNILFTGNRLNGPLKDFIVSNLQAFTYNELRFDKQRRTKMMIIQNTSVSFSGFYVTSAKIHSLKRIKLIDDEKKRKRKKAWTAGLK